MYWVPHRSGQLGPGSPSASGLQENEEMGTRGPRTPLAITRVTGHGNEENKRPGACPVPWAVGIPR